MSLTSAEVSVSRAGTRSSREGSLRVDALVGWRAVLEARECWETLESRQEAGIPCHGWAAAMAIREQHLSEGSRGDDRAAPGLADRAAPIPVVVLARCEGRPVGLWPLQFEPRPLAGRITNLGHGLLPRHAPLLAPEAPPGLDPVDLLHATSTRIAPRARVRLARNAPASSGGQWLRARLETDDGWSRSRGAEEVRLDLREGWSRVAASLTRAFRERAQSSDRRLRGPRGSIRVLSLAPSGPDTAGPLLEDADLDTSPCGPFAGVVRRLVFREAAEGRVSAWLAVDAGGVRAASLIWRRGGQAVELWAGTRSGGSGHDAMAVLRWDQLHELARDPGCAALTLAPGHGTDLVPVPEHQSEIRGALGSALFRCIHRWLQR